MTANRPKIVVLGSINMDLVAMAPALPKPGETVMGSEFATLPGGKGANQAVAAARLGADVRMIGRVGDDVFGPMLIENLDANGVDVPDVMITPGMSSGIAVILLDDERENYIVGIYGANMACDEIQVQATSLALDGADALLLQMEIPLDVSLEAARIARQKEVRVIYDPAPPSEIPFSSYQSFDIIAPNQSEAEVLTGVEVSGIDSAYKAASILRVRGAHTALIKLGEQGVVYSTGDFVGHVPSPFRSKQSTPWQRETGSQARSCSRPLPKDSRIERALRFASAAGALVVTKRGAQDAMPHRAEVERLLDSQ